MPPTKDDPEQGPVEEQQNSNIIKKEEDNDNDDHIESGGEWDLFDIYDDSNPGPSFCKICAKPIPQGGINGYDPLQHLLVI